MNNKRRALLAATILAAAATIPLTAGAQAAKAVEKPAVASTTGVTNNEIIIGQSAPLSGPAKELGLRMNVGAKAYFTSLNNAGGVNGRKITLKVLDDQYDPPKAKANTEQFVKEGVFALFGYVGTPTTNAAKPVFTAAKVPLVGAFTGAAGLRNPVSKYIFNVRAGYNDEMENQVEEILNSGAKKIAIFYQDDAYGKAGLDGALLAMKKHNVKPSVLATHERNTVKVEEAVAKIAADKPDAVILVSAYSAVTAFTKQMRAQGQNPLFYNLSFVGSMALLNELGQKDGPGVIVTQVVPFPWAPAIPIVAEYQEAMKKIGDTNYEFTSLEGFISAKVLAEGLKRAGRDLTRDSLINGLESMEIEDLGGFVVKYSPEDHSGSTLVETTMIGNKGSFIQ